MKTGSKSWQQLRRTQVFENNWFKIQHDQVLTPAQKEGTYTFVDFKNDAIGIVALDQHLDIYLVGQWRYPLEQYSWELPMGGCPVGTDLLESAKRELKEETGLFAQKWELLMTLHTSNSVTNETGYVFVATYLEVGKNDLEESEADLVVWKLPFWEAYKMVLDGKITDAISVSGILRMAVRLKD